MKSETGVKDFSRTPPPASLVPLPFQGRLIYKLTNAVQNKVYRLYRQYLKEPTLQIQARATIGVGKPQADSERNERIPPDGFDMAALENRCS